MRVATWLQVCKVNKKRFNSIINFSVCGEVRRTDGLIDRVHKSLKASFKSSKRPKKKSMKFEFFSSWEQIAFSPIQSLKCSKLRPIMFKWQTNCILKHPLVFYLFECFEDWEWTRRESKVLWLPHGNLPVTIKCYTKWMKLATENPFR